MEQSAIITAALVIMKNVHSLADIVITTENTKRRIFIDSLVENSWLKAG